VRRINLAVAAVLIIAAGIAGISLTPAAPARAQVSCTNWSIYTDVSGWAVAIPTIGMQTYRDNCDLGLGNDSQAVAALQDSLNHCYGQHLTVDGIYGPLTQAAVEYAQRSAGITVDGIYGPQTRDHIKWWDHLTPCARL
jgi:peptidoglycan hydrolase-like protein with peptidoglycan-binding domain